jgi:hypothetical protein
MARLKRACLLNEDADAAKARALAREILNDWDAITAFVTNPDLPPTNNDAETALRHAVIARRISFGTRTEEGSRAYAAILSVIETCGGERSMRGVSSQKPSGMPGEANRQRPSRHLPNPGKVNGYIHLGSRILYGNLKFFWNHCVQMNPKRDTVSPVNLTRIILESSDGNCVLSSIRRSSYSRFKASGN